jgi:hypothetical protein
MVAKSAVPFAKFSRFQGTIQLEPLSDRLFSLLRLTILSIIEFEEARNKESL